MKLISRFILIYLIITVIVLGIGGYLSYFIIQDELNSELKWRFLDRIERVTYLLKQGEDFGTANFSDSGDANLVVHQLPVYVEPSTAIEDTMVWHGRLQQLEPNLKMTAYRTVDDTSYFISTYGALIETDDITKIVIKILLWILAMQIIGAIGMGFIVSTRLFKPFRNTLVKIKDFDLRKRQPIRAESTSVKEFNDLNRFVEGMTQKMIHDYNNVKEFAENASHEFKTPLAIVQGKLELLAETSLNKEQHLYIEASQRSISKLTKLSSSLGLLTKIDNEEFSQKNSIDFTKLINQSLESFHELIKLKRITVNAELQPDVKITMHGVLADILWMNLFQNAIKHNIVGGTISIKLTQEKLILTNTGEPLNIPTEELFKRFKKSDPNAESIGLGLSIVKQIADHNQFQLTYTFKKPVHQVEVFFTTS